MPLTETQLIDWAIELLRRKEHHAAHLLLADAFNSDTRRTDLARIANLIAPCQMFDAAELDLIRLKFQPLIGPGDIYELNPPIPAALATEGAL